MDDRTASSRSRPRPVEEHTDQDAALKKAVNAKLADTGMTVHTWTETTPDGVVRHCAHVRFGSTTSAPVKQPSAFAAEELIAAAKEWHQELINRIDDRDPWTTDLHAADRGWD